MILVTFLQSWEKQRRECESTKSEVNKMLGLIVSEVIAFKVVASEVITSVGPPNFRNNVFKKRSETTRLDYRNTRGQSFFA